LMDGKYYRLTTQQERYRTVRNKPQTAPKGAGEYKSSPR